jgi:hypothetical protein
MLEGKSSWWGGKWREGLSSRLEMSEMGIENSISRPGPPPVKGEEGT